MILLASVWSTPTLAVNQTSKGPLTSHMVNVTCFVICSLSPFPAFQWRYDGDDTFMLEYKQTIIPEGHHHHRHHHHHHHHHHCRGDDDLPLEYGAAKQLCVRKG